MVCKIRSVCNMRTVLFFFFFVQQNDKTQQKRKKKHFKASRKAMKCFDGFRLHTLFLISIDSKNWMALRADLL